MSQMNMDLDAARTRLWHWVWPGAAIALVVAGFLGLDRWFYEHVSLVLDTPDQPLKRGFYAVTKPLWLTLRLAMGYAVAGVLIFVVAVVLKPERWRTMVVAAASVAIAGLVANVLQGAIGRVRPNLAPSHLTFRPFAELLTKQGVSFPSGEAATAFALAAVLAHLFPRGRALFYVLGALTAGARLINGAHYVSDVAAGALLGESLGRWAFARTERLLSRVQG